MVKVLFVCLGNICRSPTAEGVFTALINREGLSDVVSVDSAGTGAWHVGDQPDRRAQAAAKTRGYDLSTQRARQIKETDFLDFDYIIAMDSQNHSDLSMKAPTNALDRIHMFLSFAPKKGITDVPDPYYGGADGFNHVLDLIEAASLGLLHDMRKRHFIGD